VYVRTKAKIIILDEALGQMDAFKKREVVFPRLFDFVDKHNMALILISHDLVSQQEQFELLLWLAINLVIYFYCVAGEYETDGLCVRLGRRTIGGKGNTRRSIGC
jgi:ABC-type Mn2+/Zn2+ transport system ATPase subunit